MPYYQKYNKTIIKVSWIEYANKSITSDRPLCVFFHGKTTKPPRYNFATIKKDTKSPNKSEENC